MKKLTTLLLILIMTFSAIPLQTEAGKVKAEVLYISVEDFAHELVNQMGLQATVDNEASRYINCLMDIGVIKEGDIADDKADLKRGDMLVLLCRADDYLNSPKIEDDLVQEVIEKRISDIEKVVKAKKEDLAKGYIKGFLKGYSNGAYSPDRELKVNNKIVKTDAIKCIKMLTNRSLRAKISPDGQLIRTTNLPKYAKYYPYILESYPNAYYNWKFRFEDQVKRNPETNEVTPYKNIDEYAAPVDIDKIKDFDNFKEVKGEYLDLWVEKVRTYMECVFNADYRTIDDDWVNKILSTNYGYNDENKRDSTKKDILKYVSEMKKNKTIVESSKIAVDGSSLYFYKGRYVIRTYVKYRINSSKVKPGADADTLIYENPYGTILYTSDAPVCLSYYQIGQWKEGYYDVELSWIYRKEPDNIGILQAILDELLYEKRRVD